MKVVQDFAFYALLGGIVGARLYYVVVSQPDYLCAGRGKSWRSGTAGWAFWAITYTDPRGMAPLNVPLHPAELYEIAAYLLVFAVVWSTRAKYKTEGMTFLTYLAGYGAARFAVEFFRGHPATLGPDLPAAQVFGLALLLVSAAGWLFAVRSAPKGLRP